MHQRDLGDALGVVAHALEVDDDVQDRDDRAQVASHRLLGGDQLDRLLLDLEALAVDQRVVVDDRRATAESRCTELTIRAVDRLVHHATQQQDLVLQVLEF